MTDAPQPPAPPPDWHLDLQERLNRREQARLQEQEAKEQHGRLLKAWQDYCYASIGHWQEHTWHSYQKHWLQQQALEQAASDISFDPFAEWPRLTPGGQFILDGEQETGALWGQGDQVLWAPGEPLMIGGPTGVGKTTLANQLIHARLGLADTVLGLPVAQDSRKILILSMDRPKQARKAMRRLFGEQHRQLLDQQVIIHRGPLAGSLTPPKGDPALLHTMCQAVGCGLLVIDSLKDLALKLSDDEVAGNVNRAIQLVIAEGVDIIILHHQRKRDQAASTTKPSTIDDIYGNQQITAGCGSVIVLWGKAGDPLVELLHLKQPSAEVGPLTVEHDATAGTFSVYRGFDALTYLRNRGQAGSTIVDAARQMFGKTGDQKVTDIERKKCQRRLDKLVDEQLARKETGAHKTDAAVYYAVQQLDGVLDIPNAPIVGRSLDTHHKTAGQKLDATLDAPWTPIPGVVGRFPPPLKRGETTQPHPLHAWIGNLNDENEETL